MRARPSVPASCASAWAFVPLKQTRGLADTVDVGKASAAVSRASPQAYTCGYPRKRLRPVGEPMAFRTKNRKTERGEVELLRGLIKLANQLQSSLTLDAIVHVSAMALSDTFGFREASVYLRSSDGDFAVHATVGEFPEFDRMLFERPVPKEIWDQLFL